MEAGEEEPARFLSNSVIASVLVEFLVFDGNYIGQIYTTVYLPEKFTAKKNGREGKPIWKVFTSLNSTFF